MVLQKFRKFKKKCLRHDHTYSFSQNLVMTSRKSSLLLQCVQQVNRAKVSGMKVTTHNQAKKGRSYLGFFKKNSRN